ncbi:hypothetical protein GGF49_003034 [Coemansia sp. RSA 1853]|nr:hypothetical protein GGF49_003034 [Coemansia sp. RSA 1853]
MDKAGHNDGSWAITRFFREEVLHPQKIGSNVGVLYGVGVFAGVVYFLDKYGELLIQRESCTALFNFQSLMLVVLLTICTCTYLRAQAPSLVDRNKTGFVGLFWKAARIGERLSPYVSIACFVMAFQLIMH